MQVGGQRIGLPFSPVPLRQTFRSTFIPTSAILPMPALVGIAILSSAVIFIAAETTLASAADMLNPVVRKTASSIRKRRFSDGRGIIRLG